MIMYRILIAEDDKDIAELMRLYLTGENYEVAIGYDGLEALELFKKQEIHLAIVDVMMPGLDGYGLIEEMRKISNVPVIILSAKDRYSDKIYGLEMGADVYLTKPFNPSEVLANVKAVLRRYYKLGGQEHNEIKGSNIKVKDLTLDMNTMTVYRGKDAIALTVMEAKILAVLMGTPGKVFTREQIARAVRADYAESDIGVIAVHISKVRSKLEDSSSESKYITTIRGLGYKFEK